MRRTFDARRTLLPTGAGTAATTAVTAITSLLFLASCNRNDEPTPGPTPVRSTAASSPAARPVPSAPAGPAPANQPLPVASREPDWGLDAGDAARDYVTRYLRATKRYGAQSGCVVVSPSKFTGEKSIVEVRNDASGACGKADELRDRFFVTVATDRMSLDDSLHPPKLQPWPDGSDPGAAPAKVADIQDLRAWRTDLREAFRKLTLAPLRVQLYGRGTYPVVTIAGWHGDVQPTMTPGQLEAPAKALCAASQGEPMGILAGLDRATLLRIRCPGSASFESL